MVIDYVCWHCFFCMLDCTSTTIRYRYSHTVLPISAISHCLVEMFCEYIGLCAPRLTLQHCCWLLLWTLTLSKSVLLIILQQTSYYWCLSSRLMYNFSWTNSSRWHTMHTSIQWWINYCIILFLSLLIHCINSNLNNTGMVGTKINWPAEWSQVKAPQIVMQLLKQGTS